MNTANFCNGCYGPVMRMMDGSTASTKETWQLHTPNILVYVMLGTLIPTTSHTAQA